MSEEFDLFGEPRGRKGEPSKAGSGTGRSGLSPRPVGRPPRYGHGSFLSRVNKSVAKAHASRGTNRYSKSKPKTGRCKCRNPVAKNLRHLIANNHGGSSQVSQCRNCRKGFTRRYF